MNNLDVQQFNSLSDVELSNINGGALFSIVIGGVTYAVSAKAAAGIAAGLYTVAYAIGKGWAYVKN